MTRDDIERAERTTRARALLMTIAAVVLLLNLYLQFGDPDYVGANARGGSWIMVVGIWLFILWNGGGLNRNPTVCAIVNDELSLHNRRRALAGGFYAAIAAGLAIYVAQWWLAMSAGDALKIVTAAGLSTALLRYAWLEWR
jgi:hypothetical protein